MYNKKRELDKSTVPEWVDNHIVKSDSGMFLAYDETSADVIGIYSTYHDAAQSLIDYATWREWYGRF